MNKEEIEKLHSDLLSAWNNQDARSMASLFSKDANLIGFDGSQINGQANIEPEMSKVFSDHKTASYVWKVEEVRFLSSQIALLRAIVGMIPPGKKEINPERNAIQSLVAIGESETWKISLFQNTPAQFHGRPQLVDQMTKQLNELIKQ
jgi:uncharacterized protein (TIGR02246 family)